MSRLPIKTKKKAFTLRARGYSVKEIADELHIAKGTSSLWVRNIKLNKKAKERLKERKFLGYYRSSLTWQKKRASKEKEYRLRALKRLNNIRKNPEYNKIYCAILYWCEGTKNYKDGVRFTNSDPELIKTFLTLLRKSFLLDEKRFRALMHLHFYHKESRQLKFWSQITKIPKSQFLKSFWKKSEHIRIKPDYQGCLSLRYNDSNIARQLQYLYKEFAKLNN